jgi:hypothetical protein
MHRKGARGWPLDCIHGLHITALSAWGACVILPGLSVPCLVWSLYDWKLKDTNIKPAWIARYEGMIYLGLGFYIMVERGRMRIGR